MEASDAKPVAADAQPVAADVQPVVADTKPTAPDTKPVAADTEPSISTQFATLGLHTMADPKASTDTRPTTPPFSPSSQTPVLEKEQEEFQGTVHVDNSIPTQKDLARVADLLVLDAQGQSRPFKELYKAPGVAPRQLVIFIRHFFCGVSTLQSPTSTHTPY
jgi:hypothetical protein